MLYLEIVISDECVLHALPVELTKEKIAEIREKIEQKNSVFAQKRYLDSMVMPSKILGREPETEKLLDCIMSLRDGFVVPLVSVYGRSGSGKSTVVKFVCENMLDLISFRFVNLRKAKTVFGCANIILENLGSIPLLGSQGLNKAVDCIESQIASVLQKDGKKYFVLVLDEYDVVFSDSRANPSDFVYKLLQMEENLRERGMWVCIVTISNNILQEYDLDDRVKSRMGSVDVSFLPYSKSDVLAILCDRAEKAFAIPVPKEVLEHCALMSSSDHGDARRALDLLRTAGEMCDGTRITKGDIDSAQKMLQKDRVHEIVSTAPYHLRCVAAAVCWLAIINQESWSATSSVYKKYADIASKTNSPLSYRRVSDLLVELENSGLLVSRAYSRGRNGYGKEYKLKVSPDLVGPSIDEKWFYSVLAVKASRDNAQHWEKLLPSSDPLRRYSKMFYDRL